MKLSKTKAKINVINVPDWFLWHNITLTCVELPKATHIGMDFMCFNRVLTYINLPKVTYIGKSFLYFNEELTVLNVPKIMHIECTSLPITKKIINI